MIYIYIIYIDVRTMYQIEFVILLYRSVDMYINSAWVLRPSHRKA